MVLNLIAVGGFITFWGKCNIRTPKGIGLEASADLRRHTHFNITGQDTSITQEILLRRLGSLEDVVYRQLNGRLREDNRTNNQAQAIKVGGLIAPFTCCVLYRHTKKSVCCSE